MAKIQPQYTSLAGITNANFATNAVKCDIASKVSVQGVVTVAGSPSSATLQCTLDPHELIDAGTANWVSELSSNSTNFTQSANGPVTGVRLSIAASGGTWTFVVRQAYDSTVQN